MYKVIIYDDKSQQIVFFGPEFACEQYVNTVHPNGVFITGKEWNVKIMPM